MSLKPVPNARHTLGPWRVKEINHDGARVAFGLVGCGCNIYGAPDREANALLIAAAPDLLKALQQIAEADYGTDTPKLRATARAAIAKVQA
ncbi:MAG: hypothetical protein WCP31_08385 [Chloroflexales bacterium]